MGAKRQNGIINAVIFILLEVAACLCLVSTGSLQDIWLSRASHRTLGALWHWGESIRGYFSLGEENRALAEENARLAEELRRYEGRSLAAEAGARADTVTGSYAYTPATIVKMSRNTQHNYIILNKGRADGITPHSGIIAANGVVGIVNAVDENFCYGITLQNVLTSVSARIGHTGPAAPVEWSGRRSNLAIMKNLPIHVDVAPGDTVWTSGFSNIFPPDIPLGITGRTRQVDGAVNEVEVELFLDFNALRYVTIVENLDRKQIERLEGGAGEQ